MKELLEHCQQSNAEAFSELKNVQDEVREIRQRILRSQQEEYEKLLKEAEAVKQEYAQVKNVLKQKQESLADARKKFDAELKGVEQAEKDLNVSYNRQAMLFSIDLI